MSNLNTCYRTTNNKHFNCPPRMDDARHFTDYRPNCHINNLVRANNAIMNSHEYRMFLTRNANKLIDLNRGYATEKNSCGPCTNTMLPEQSVQSCNAKSCSTGINNKNGLGLGRNYDKNSQECKDWPNYDKPYSCCADTNSMFNYYNHIDKKTQGELMPRKTVQGGGDMLSGGDPVPFNL